jgi:hypothetical protein
VEEMMKTHSETNEINRIEKRAIEASVVAPIIQAVAQRIGKEEALAILQEVNEKEAFQRGESIRNKLGNTGIPELVDDVATLGIGGVLEMEVLEQTTENYHFNITRCPYFEKYRELGLTEYGSRPDPWLCVTLGCVTLGCDPWLGPFQDPWLFLGCFV